MTTADLYPHLQCRPGRGPMCVALVVAVGLAFAVGGCGGDDLGRKAVSGSVTLDDKPLESGSIRFEPIGAGSVSTGAAIIHGGYSIDASAGLPPGQYRVAITSPTSTGPAAPSMDNDGAAPLPEDRIPPQYNTQTTLKVEVKEGEPAEFNFPLASAAK